MALLRDYELIGTGLIVPNAYHVVTKVDVEKRVKDIEGPKDTSMPDQRTANHQRPGQEVHWKAGYIGKISITVWKDETARQSGNKPLGFLGVNPSDNIYYGIASTSGDNSCQFFLDMDSSKNHIEQAYDHLLTTEYYSGSIRV